jgi:hypothetical protein
MTLSDEARRPVHQWVKDHPGQECRGDERHALMAHLKIHFPNKTPQQLESTLNQQIRKTRDVIAPEKTPQAYNPRALGAPTAVSKEVQDVQNAIHNPINSPIRRAAMKRELREEAIAMLEEKGYKDLILTEKAVEELVDDILIKPRPEFDNDSMIDLLDKTISDDFDFCLYVGFTKQRIPKEAFEFMGRHGANLPRKRDGEIPRNRPVLLRRDGNLPEKQPHFTAMLCREELHMKYVMVYFSELKLNCHFVEDALQSRLQCYPRASDCGGRWPRAKETRTSRPKRA